VLLLGATLTVNRPRHPPSVVDLVLIGLIRPSPGPFLQLRSSGADRHLSLVLMLRPPMQAASELCVPLLCRCRVHLLVDSG